MSTVLLLTGRPGVGKTTVIQTVAKALPRESLGGFYTEEVREQGRRRGFRGITFDDWTRSIADVNHPGPARVGCYGVDVAAIDALVERSPARPMEADFYLIDGVSLRGVRCRHATAAALIDSAGDYRG